MWDCKQLSVILWSLDNLPWPSPFWPFWPWLVLVEMCPWAFAALLSPTHSLAFYLWPRSSGWFGYGALGSILFSKTLLILLWLCSYISGHPSEGFTFLFAALAGESERNQSHSPFTFSMKTFDILSFLTEKKEQETSCGRQLWEDRIHVWLLE